MLCRLYLARSRHRHAGQENNKPDVWQTELGYSFHYLDGKTTIAALSR